MKKICIYLLVCLILLGVGACSQSEKDQEAQTKDEVQSTGQKIANEIKKPIDKANLAKELTEDHNRTIDENVNDK
jgi:hypothetical protein